MPLAAHHVRFGGMALAVCLLGASAASADPAATVAAALREQPIIDGHNDLPWEIRTKFAGDPARVKLELTAAAANRQPPLQTDIPRLRRGGVGGQFWSIYVPGGGDGPAMVKATLEQIGVLKAIVSLHPETFEMAYTAADVRRIQKAGRIASLMGVEGGHSIDGSLDVLRAYQQAGVRYMTLTHSQNTAWAGSATGAPASQGLTPFGEEVVREMNRLGMLVDLSHVSEETMRAALRVSQAPVIFSHSSAGGVAANPRNVPDDVLRLVRGNGGVVMVAFVPAFLSPDGQTWIRARFQAAAAAAERFPGQPDKAAQAIDSWVAQNPGPKATLAMVADHIDHIRRVAGVDHVGLGGDFDGTEDLPAGLEDVSTYPVLLTELARRGWSKADLRKLQGENILRALLGAEAVANRQAPARPRP